MPRYFNMSLLIIACFITSSCESLYKRGNDLYPVVTPDGSVFDKEIKVFLGFPENDVEIRFTADGAEPDLNSAVYKDAITLKESSLIKATAFKDNQAIGKTVQV